MYMCATQPCPWPQDELMESRGSVSSSRRPQFGVESVTARYPCSSEHASEITRYPGLIGQITLLFSVAPPFFLPSFMQCCARYRLHHVRTRLYSTGLKRGLDCSASRNLAERNSVIVAHSLSFPLCFNALHRIEID